MVDFEIMGQDEVVAYLTENVGKLSAKDIIFATSLMTSVKGSRFPASHKQMHWLRELAKRTIPQERKKVEVGSLDGIYALFDQAKAKRPAVVIGEGADTVRLSVAGAEARVPGSINVSTAGAFSERAWYGRILKTGEFEMSPRVATPDAVIDLLRRFSADPAGIAAEHGRRTGVCCFCNRGLNDKRSIEVGYGPICADKFGLSWGAKVAA